MSRQFPTTLAVFLFFSALACVFSAGWLPSWSTQIPGGHEDTRLFLWNAWWFHFAIGADGLSAFQTDRLFHPFGCSLVSHDYPLWTNLVTHAGQSAGLPLIAASNIWFLLTWALAGFCTYLLAWEVTGRRWAALVAGLFVMTHSYTLARAMQNWGQFNLYGIPLFLWLLIRAGRSARWRDSVLAGMALAWTAACHYYFLIYSGLIWLVWVLVRLWPYRYRFQFRASPRRLTFVFFGIAALAAGIAAWILLAHPGQLMLLGKRISLTTPANALLVMWITLFLGLTGYWRCEAYPVTRAAPDVRHFFLRQAALAGTALCFLSPLLISAVLMSLQGDYPSQTILWKTHNRGADLFSLGMPNPLQAWWGPTVSRWFLERNLLPQDQAASLGWICLLIIGISRPWRMDGAAKRWLVLAVAATLCAMGTTLRISDWDTSMPLPFYGMRLLPILSNVRVPERWMAVGSVAWGVLLAIALVRLADQKRWRLGWLAVVVGFLILIENWPGLPSKQPPSNQPVYDTLKALPPGGVLTAPLFIGDSSRGAGDSLPGELVFPWDHLWAQTFHHQPIVGGYIGRIPRHWIGRYKEDGFIAEFLRLEEGGDAAQPLPNPEAIGCRMARALDVSYVLAYPAYVRTPAWDFVRRHLPLKPMDQSGGTELYRVDTSRCPAAS